jgi:prophage maintenance system killer protein
MSLHYLTIQDILWINLQVTKKVQRFHYAKLEEASFYQYAYGASNSLLAQAARFLPGFARLGPFSAGNDQTAFVAFAAFLEVNGATLDLDDRQALAWVRSALDSPKSLSLQGKVTEGEHGEHGAAQPDVREAVQNVLRRYPKTIEELADPRRIDAAS